MNEATNTPHTPRGERTILVHKNDAEGALIINALDGMIKQDPSERPEWADGLACALLAERHQFYTTRLGPDYAKSHAQPDLLAFEDLGWIGVDADGNPVELEADSEHRMTVVAEVLGIIRSDDLSDTRQDDTTGEQAHVLLDMDTRRTAEDVTAMEKAGATVSDAKTGT